MSHEKKYRVNVRIGNWMEDLCLEEDEIKAHLEKKEKGELTAQKVDFLKENLLKPMRLSVIRDGVLHIGDSVVLVNMGGQSRKNSAISINSDINGVRKLPTPGVKAPCRLSAGMCVQPCVRTVFVISSVDGSPEGSVLRYDQNFTLKTTNGFAGGLYMSSDLHTFEKTTRFQEVNLEKEVSFLSWWKIVHFDPQERLEEEGQPVAANVKVLILHCKTNQALAVLGGEILWTAFGKEYEVTARTLLDSHKAEQDCNHWILCTSDPAGEGLLHFNHPPSVPGMHQQTK